MLGWFLSESYFKGDNKGQDAVSGTPRYPLNTLCTDMKMYILIHPVELNNPKNIVKYWNLHCNCDVASTTCGLHQTNDTALLTSVAIS